MLNQLQQWPLEKWFNILNGWFYSHILSLENLLQVIAIAVTFAVGFLLGKPLRGFLKSSFQSKLTFHILVKSLFLQVIRVIPLLLSSIFLWIFLIAFHRYGAATFLISLILNLTFAWILIQIAVSVIPNPYWARLVSFIVWFIAALNILGLLEPATNFLSNTGFQFGDTRLTILSVIQILVLFTILLKSVVWLSEYLSQKLKEVPGIQESTRLILSKVFYIVLIVFSSFIVLNTVGIDLSSLALFSGAIGVGVGFGLQKVAGNYISGLILLADRSVKPGDVIQLADAVGRVQHMGGRFISVVTRDEKEYLIPNEDLITQQVVNWSHTNNILRLKVGFGVSYKSNPHQIIDWMKGAVKDIERILEDPGPVCFLKEFASSSIDFELHYWINDPQNGVDNINSEVLLMIWDVLQENNIEIPFPQVDVHMKS